jgi:dipeptidyl aminopeptidase/acylaminoacyl peptidase
MSRYWRQTFKVIALFALVLSGAGMLSLGHHELDQKLHTYKMSLVGYNGEIVKAGRAIGDVQVRGDYAYVAAGIKKRGLVILNVKDPANPTIVSELTLEDATSLELKVNAEGTLVALTNEIIDYNFGSKETIEKSFLGLTFVDVSDKANPKIVGRWENKTPEGHREGCHNVFLHRHYAYCASFGGGSGRGVVIVDISDLKDPKEIGFLPNPPASSVHAGEHGSTWTHDVWVWEHASGRAFAYVANGHGGLQIWDVTAPGYPIKLSSWTEWGTDLWIHTAVPSPSGKITVVGPESETGHSGFLSIFDTSDIQNPQLLSTWSIPGHHWQPKKFGGFYSWSPHNFEVTDDRIYLGNYAAGVWAIDISDPTNPKTIGSFGPESYKPIPEGVPGIDSIGLKPHAPNSWTAQEENGYLFVSDIFTGLYVLKLEPEPKQTETKKPEEKKTEQTKTAYSVGQYLDMQSSGSGRLSPDGAQLLFTNNATGTSQIYKLDLKTNQTKQLTNYEDGVGLIDWTHDGSQILFGKSSGGNERTQLYLMSADGNEFADLSQEPKAIHGFGDWSPDGSKIAFSSNRRNAAYFDIYIQDLKTKEISLIYQSDASNSIENWSPNGNYLVLSVASGSANNDLYLLNLATKETKHLTPHEGTALYFTGPWTLDNKGFFVVSDQGREFSNLAYFDLAENKLSFIEDYDWDIEDVKLAHDGKTLATLANVEGYHALRLWSWPEREQLITPNLPAGLISSLRFSQDDQKLTFTLSGSTIASEVWVFDLETQAVKQLTKSDAAGIDPASFIEPELIKYESFDGLVIPAFFYLPKGAKKDSSLPVIIDIHGGPESQSRPSFSRLNQFFLNHGYAILRPNVRGSTGYGKTYTHLDDVKLREDSVKDIAYAIEWLKGSGYIDAKKIVAMGGSYGGYMTLACLTLYPDLFAAGVDTVGIANFVSFLELTSPYRRKLRESEYGSLETDRDFLASISPIHKVDKIKAPLFVIHGANDPRVPINEAEQIVAAVKQRGGIVEYLRFEDEGHGLAKRENQIKAYTRVVEFLDQYLQR